MPKKRRENEKLATHESKGVSSSLHRRLFAASPARIVSRYQNILAALTVLLSTFSLFVSSTIFDRKHSLIFSPFLLPFLFHLPVSSSLFLRPVTDEYTDISTSLGEYTSSGDINATEGIHHFNLTYKWMEHMSLFGVYCDTHFTTFQQWRNHMSDFLAFTIPDPSHSRKRPRRPRHLLRDQIHDKPKSGIFRRVS